MQDLIDRLDAELQSAPVATFDALDTLPAGRRAVRRRRLAIGAGVCAIALAVSATVPLWGAGGDGPAHDDLQTAASPSPGPSAGLLGSPTPESEPYLSYNNDGTVAVEQGWRIVRRVEDPVTGPARNGERPIIDDSIAAVVQKGSEIRWQLIHREKIDRNKSGVLGGGAVGAPGLSFTTFERWLAFWVDLTRRGWTDRLVTIDAEGTLTPRPEVTIVDQTTVEGIDPDAPARIAALAHLRIGQTDMWVEVTRAGRATVEYAPAQSKWRTLAEFERYLRDEVYYSGPER